MGTSKDMSRVLTRFLITSVLRMIRFIGEADSLHTFKALLLLFILFIYLFFL